MFHSFWLRRHLYVLPNRFKLFTTAGTTDEARLSTGSTNLAGCHALECKNGPNSY